MNAASRVSTSSRRRVSPVGVALLALLAAACKDSSETASLPTAAPGENVPGGSASGAEDAAAPPASSPRTYDFGALEIELFGSGARTEGVVVQHEGRLVYEKYAAGFDAEKRHITYSVSKSVGGALVGIAVDEGLLKLEDSVCKYVPARPGSDPTYCETKVDHVLRMSSGLAWEESYESDPAQSNVLQMLYGNEPDMGLYVATRPRAHPAGTFFYYSSGDANLLALVLKAAIGGKDMHTWAKEKLFDRAEMRSAIFEADRSGTLVFSSSCFLTVRDMARFGQLYLDDGMHGASRVLSSAWVQLTKTPAPTNLVPVPREAGVAGTGGSYGAAFWLNTATPTAAHDTYAYADAPSDMFGAQGHWGQMIFVVPSRKLVVARVGNDREPRFDPGLMMKLAAQTIDAGGRP